MIVSESVQVKKGFAIGCLDDFVRSLILIMAKTNGYVKNVDNNKLMSFSIVIARC